MGAGPRRAAGVPGPGRRGAGPAGRGVRARDSLGCVCPEGSACWLGPRLWVRVQTLRGPSERAVCLRPRRRRPPGREHRPGLGGPVHSHDPHRRAPSRPFPPRTSRPGPLGTFHLEDTEETLEAVPTQEVLSARRSLEDLGPGQPQGWEHRWSALAHACAWRWEANHCWTECWRHVLGASSRRRHVQGAACSPGATSALQAACCPLGGPLAQVHLRPAAPEDAASALSPECALVSSYPERLERFRRLGQGLCREA